MLKGIQRHAKSLPYLETEYSSDEREYFETLLRRLSTINDAHSTHLILSGLPLNIRHRFEEYCADRKKITHFFNAFKSLDECFRQQYLATLQEYQQLGLPEERNNQLRIELHQIQEKRNTFLCCYAKVKFERLSHTLTENTAQKKCRHTP